MRRRTGPRLHLALAAALLGVLPGPAGAAAALPPETDSWIQVQTAHFTLYSNASERRTLDLGRRLGRFRGVLSRFNKKFRIDPPVTTSIYVFKDNASLTPYKKRFNGRPVELSGLFVGHPDGAYIILNGSRQGDPLEVTYHEYTHHFLGNNLNGVPVWFGEGLAECYGTFRADDKTASIGLTQNNHVLYLRDNALIPLHDLFAITESSADYNEGERRGVFYAESWALMHYLMWDKPERKPQFLRFLDRLSSGEDPDTAFPASFETSYQALENELRAYVRQARFTYTVLKLSDLAIDENVKVAPMKREETLFRLGDLMGHIDRDRAGEAEEIFKEALRLAPDYAAAHAGLAWLAGEAGRYDEAVTLFEKAIALDPNDPMICFYFGQCLARRSSSAPPSDESEGATPGLARARELFGKAIQMRPGFAEAYVEYARVLMLEGGEPGPAIHLLEVARPLLPSRTDIVANLAVLYARKGDMARARDLVENVLARMGDRETLGQVRSRIQIEAEHRAALQAAAGRQTAGPGEGAEAVDAGPADTPPSVTVVPPSGTGTGAAPESMATYGDQVIVYNQAVARANRGDYKGAIAILENLLRQVKDEDLRAQITTFLERLRKDAARPRKRGG